MIMSIMTMSTAITIMSTTIMNIAAMTIHHHHHADEIFTSWGKETAISTQKRAGEDPADIVRRNRLRYGASGQRNSLHGGWYLEAV